MPWKERMKTFWVLQPPLLGYLEPLLFSRRDYSINRRKLP